MKRDLSSRRTRATLCAVAVAILSAPSIAAPPQQPPQAQEAPLLVSL